MAVDLDRLKSWITQTKFQRENNPAYQSLIGMVQGVQDNLAAIGEAQTAIANINETFTKITIVELDTSGSPQSIALSDYQNFGLMIVKDVTGNASGSNITILGTVDATVNPVINTNYGIYHVFQSSDGSYHTW